MLLRATFIPATTNLTLAFAMTSISAEYYMHLLVDSAMAGGALKYLATIPAFPAWAIPIYRGEAAKQSPLVLDVERAWLDGEIDQLMALVNAVQPQLHFSVIDTLLSADALAQHLRHFIFITTEENKQLTLRFADCAVLSELSVVLTQDQYTALAGPMLRWRIHHRDGKLGTRAPADKTAHPAPTPLALSGMQIEAMYERMAPYQVLAQVRNNRPGSALPGNAAEQYQWASDVRAAWRNPGNTSEEALVLLAEAVLSTSGRLMDHRLWHKIVETSNTVQLQASLREALAHDAPFKTEKG